MKASYKHLAVQGLILCLMLAVSCAVYAQQGQRASAKGPLTGRYEGTAKNKADDVISVTLDLTDKDGMISGKISSSHGNFPITSGSHQGEAVNLEFDAGGPVGTISLRVSEDKLVGTWSAGDDGGPVDVKRIAEEGTPKDKS